MSEYRYNCTDKSIVLPYFKKYYVSFFFRFVPHVVTANTITLISTGFIVLMLFVSIRFDTINTGLLPLLLAFCLHNYVVGDHLDGMQAKNTNTSSPLGEYMDHYLDVFNGAIVVYVLTVFFSPIPDSVFYCILVLNSLSFAITMVEELETKQLIFGLVGTLEGLIILILFFLTWQLGPIRQFWEAELYGGYARYWVVIVIFALGYVGTLIDVIRRIGYIPKQFTAFVVVNILLAFALFRLEIGHLLGWIIISLYSGEYISKVMESYLIGKKHKYPDLLVAFAAIFFIFLEIFGRSYDEYLPVVISGLTLYLGIKVVCLFSWVVYQLKEHWLWYNP